MTELEKCEFLVDLLNKVKVELDIREASAFLSSYKWLYEHHMKLKQKSSKKVKKIEEKVKK